MTTACDALAAGLPVLTIAGKSFPSRVAASLLTAARFPDGIAESLNAYRERAIYWGNNPEALLKLRTGVLADSSNMPLFDTAARVRQLEYAYEEMWRRHSLGLPPRLLRCRRSETRLAQRLALALRRVRPFAPASRNRRRVHSPHHCASRGKSLASRLAVRAGRTYRRRNRSGRR